MMDSQDNILQQDITEESKAACTANVDNTEIDEVVSERQATTADSVSETDFDAGTTPKPASQKIYSSKQEIIDRVKEIAHAENTPAKDEIDHLKTAFYKLLFAEREAEQKTYLENGGDPDSYTMKPDDTEELFKAEMVIIKEKRAKALQKLEEEKKENLTKKQQIIEKINEV